MFVILYLFFLKLNFKLFKVYIAWVGSIMAVEVNFVSLATRIFEGKNRAVLRVGEWLD